MFQTACLLHQTSGPSENRMLEWFERTVPMPCETVFFRRHPTENIKGTQMSIVEIKVPDIGGHENVDIIAVEVKAGDTIAVDDTLITLEPTKPLWMYLLMQPAS